MQTALAEYARALERLKLLGWAEYKQAGALLWPFYQRLAAECGFELAALILF